jgi:hypothetical protein
VGRNILRTILFWRQPTAEEAFIRASDTAHLRMVKVEFWQSEDRPLIYFIFLNLPLIIILFFGEYQALFLDVLLILFVRMSKNKTF